MMSENGDSKQPLTGSDRDRPSDYQTTRTTAVPSDFAEQKKQQGDVGGFSGDYDLIELPHYGVQSDDASITKALGDCKKKVLKPYLFLLQLLGWSPWMNNVAVPRCGDKFVLILNFIYPLIITGLLVLGYLLQFSSCISRARPYYYSLSSEASVPTNCSTAGHDGLHICENPFSTYVLPDVIHLATYFYALFIFRIKENEELQTLMEQTFLRTTTDRQKGFLSQGTMTRNIRILLGIGILWLILQSMTNFLVILARLLDCRVTASGRVGFSPWIAAGDDLSDGEMYFLLVMIMMGFFAMDVVYVAVVLNYCTQCQLLIFLIRGLNERIQEKSISLHQIIRDYHEAGKFVKSLNKQLAIAVSLIEIIVVVQAIVSFVSLYDLESRYTSKATGGLFLTSGLFYVILWSAMAFIAFVQASRLTSACQSTISVSLDIRLFGYQDATPSQIDSFILYMMSRGQTAARLFGVPIRIHYILGIISSVVIVVLALVELSVLEFSVHL